MDAESSGIGAAAGIVATAVTGAIVKIFGTKKERDDDRAAATAEWRDLAAKAREDLGTCEERARQTEADLASIRDTVAGLEARHVTLQEAHSRCPERIAHLETEVSALKYALERRP